MKVPRSIGTHDGQFHADEVTACALLIFFDQADRDKVVRTRDPKRLAQCDFVCDVGGAYDTGRRIFDHHQSDYEGGLSSAGMVLQYLLDRAVLSQEEYRFLNDLFIIGVDDHDNGRLPPPVGHQSFSHVISGFSPATYGADEATLRKAFDEALDFVIGHITRLWNRYQYNRSCREEVADRMAEDKVCLMFKEAIPWLENFFYLGGESHPAKFLIMPKGDQWKLRGIPPSLERRMDVRLPLPAEWAGLMDEELEAVSGIKGAIFCHKGRFISVWETREAALAALEYTLARETENV